MNLPGENKTKKGHRLLFEHTKSFLFCHRRGCALCRRVSVLSPPSTSGTSPWSTCWTGPAAPCTEGSVEPSIVGLTVHAEICFHKMCRDGVLVQRVRGLRGREMRLLIPEGPILLDWLGLSHLHRRCWGFSASNYEPQFIASIHDGAVILMSWAHPYHFISGTRAGALEAGKLTPVVDSDDQLPGSEQQQSYQQDAPNHCHQHHQGIWSPDALWSRHRKQHLTQAHLT